MIAAVNGFAAVYIGVVDLAADIGRSGMVATEDELVAGRTILAQIAVDIVINGDGAIVSGGQVQLVGGWRVYQLVRVSASSSDGTGGFDDVLERIACFFGDVNGAALPVGRIAFENGDAVIGDDFHMVITVDGTALCRNTVCLVVDEAAVGDFEPEFFQQAALLKRNLGLGRADVTVICVIGDVIVDGTP